MAQIGIDVKEVMAKLRENFINELPRLIRESFPEGEMESPSVFESWFTATLTAVLEDYLTMVVEIILEANNQKIYADLVKMGVIKENK